MTRLRFRFFPALILVAALGAGCDINVGENGFSMDVAAGKAQDEWTRTYTLGAGGRVEIVNINGTIDVTASDGQAVSVRAERITKASNDEAARELLKKVEIVETASTDSVRIETKVPKMSWGRSGHEVRYYVKVPKGLSMNFETVNGGVRLANVDGQIVASTTNGGVRGKGLRGTVKAGTTNGGVEVELTDITGDVDLETTNGGIRLQLPEKAKASVEARCTNGGISVDDSLSVETAEKSRRRFRGAMNGGGHRVSLETTNGGIRISAAGVASEAK
jgi:DUF4097 and DUF4098 domain-containing protein YvlB